MSCSKLKPKDLKIEKSAGVSDKQVAALMKTCDQMPEMEQVGIQMTSPKYHYKVILPDKLASSTGAAIAAVHFMIGEPRQCSVAYHLDGQAANIHFRMDAEGMLFEPRVVYKNADGWQERTLLSDEEYRIAVVSQMAVLHALQAKKDFAADPQSVLAGGNTLLAGSSSQEDRARARSQIMNAWDLDPTLMEKLEQAAVEQPASADALNYIKEELQLYQDLFSRSNSAPSYFDPSKPAQDYLGEGAASRGFHRALEKITDLPAQPQLSDLTDRVQDMVYDPAIYARHLDTHFSRVMFNWYHAGMYDAVRNVAWNQCAGGPLDKEIFFAISRVSSCLEVIGGKKRLTQSLLDVMDLEERLKDDGAMQEQFHGDQTLIDSFRAYYLPKLAALNEAVMTAQDDKEMLAQVTHTLSDGGYFIAQAKKMLASDLIEE